MRRIKSKERNNGMRYCTFCKPTRVDALFREMNWGVERPAKLACDEHKDLLVDGPHKPVDMPKRDRSKPYEEDHSEAMHQLSRWYGI